MRYTIWDSGNKIYYLRFKHNEKFKCEIDGWKFVKDKHSIRACKKVNLFCDFLPAENTNRKYSLLFTPESNEFKLKPFLTKREAKVLIKEYGFKWEYDEFNDMTFVRCTCGMNLDSPSWGEVVKVPVSDLSAIAIKRLNKHQYCEDKHFALVNSDWVKERYEYEEDGIVYKNQGWRIPQKYGKSKDCPWCKIASEVQKAYNSCPVHLRLKMWFWQNFENYIMVPYMHLFGDYPKWWIERSKKAF